MYGLNRYPVKSLKKLRITDYSEKQFFKKQIFNPCPSLITRVVQNIGKKKFINKLIVIYIYNYKSLNKAHKVLIRTQTNPGTCNI